jgi:hypothetical protein
MQRAIANSGSEWRRLANAARHKIWAQSGPPVVAASLAEHATAAWMKGKVVSAAGFELEAWSGRERSGSRGACPERSRREILSAPARSTSIVKW